MARLAQGTVKHWRGFSWDEKPHVGVWGVERLTLTAADVPPGSTFDEEDTGERYIWTGERWAVVLSPESRRLETIIEELRALRLAMPDVPAEGA